MSTEPHLTQLLTVEGFISRYWELLCFYPSCREAYDAVERQYIGAFGKRKYNDYNTFKAVLSRFNAR